MDSVVVLALIFTAVVRSTGKENFANWNVETRAPAIHAETEVLAKKVPTVRVSFVCADLVIAAITAKSLPIPVDQIHVKTVVSASVKNQDIVAAVSKVVTVITANVLLMASTNYLT